MAHLTSETSFLDKSFSYTWKIHQFAKSPYHSGYVMPSTDFFFEGTEYRLKLTSDWDGGYSKLMTIYLCSNFKSSVSRTFYSVYVTTKNGENIEQKGNMANGSTPALHIKEKTVKDEVIINDCVTINCKLTSRRTIQSSIPQNEDEAELEGLSADFGSLYSNKLQADARIRVDGKEIEVHSQILSARSPVFAALFQSGMAECNSRDIEVKDIGEDAMNYLLKYIYTGLLDLKDFSAAMVADVYIAAEKYDVRGLKARCMQQMMRTLSEENLQCYLEVALLYEEKELIDFMTNFVVNRTHIIESEAWKKLIDKIPKFGCMVLSGLAKAMK